MKRFILFVVLLLVPAIGEAGTYYASSAATSFGNTALWSATSGGAGAYTYGSGTPGVGDTCEANNYTVGIANTTGTLSVLALTNSNGGGYTLNMTGASATVTIPASIQAYGTTCLTATLNSTYATILTGNITGGTAGYTYGFNDAAGANGLLQLGTSGSPITVTGGSGSSAAGVYSVAEGLGSCTFYANWVGGSGSYATAGQIGVWSYVINITCYGNATASTNAPAFYWVGSGGSNPTTSSKLIWASGNWVSSANFFPIDFGVGASQGRCAWNSSGSITMYTSGGSAVTMSAGGGGGASVVATTGGTMSSGTLTLTGGTSQLSGWGGSSVTGTLFSGTVPPANTVLSSDSSYTVGATTYTPSLTPSGGGTVAFSQGGTITSGTTTLIGSSSMITSNTGTLFSGTAPATTQLTSDAGTFSIGTTSYSPSSNGFWIGSLGISGSHASGVKWQTPVGAMTGGSATAAARGTWAGGYESPAPFPPLEKSKVPAPAPKPKKTKAQEALPARKVTVTTTIEEK